jgi:hypothetical protein
MTSLPQPDAAVHITITEVPDDPRIHEQRTQPPYGIQTQFPMHPGAIRSVIRDNQAQPLPCATGDEQLQAQQLSVATSDCNSSIGLSLSSWHVQEDPIKEVEAARAEVIRRLEQLPSTDLSASEEVEERVLEEDKGERRHFYPPPRPAN